MTAIKLQNVLEPSVSEANRRSETRMTTALPVLEIDGKRRRLMDFSRQGFRAKLPGDYRRVGATGHGIIHLSAAGHSVQKRITFQVMNTGDDFVGARFETLETITQSSVTLF